MGATAKSVLQREHSRFRKFQQLLRSQPAYFEPAFHYSYRLFSPLPVELVSPASQLWAIESAWQYTLRPQLNAPRIHRILARLGFHEHLTDFRQRAPTSLTLLKRLQRRLYTLFFLAKFIRILDEMSNINMKCCIGSGPTPEPPIKLSEN